MTTVVSILLSDIIPLKERGVWQGIINIIYATGASSGAPLGGILADFVGWRWAFLGQAPLCLLAFVSVVFALKPPAREQKDWRTNLGRIDFLGALVLITAVFCLIFGLDRGSNESWSLPISYGPLVASVFAFALFVFVEKSVAGEPFAPGHVIFERSLFSCYLCYFFSCAGWFAIQYYLPLFFQAVDGLGATGAAVRLIPAVVAGVSGSLFGWRRHEEDWEVLLADSECLRPAYDGRCYYPLLCGTCHQQLLRHRGRDGVQRVWKWYWCDLDLNWATYVLLLALYHLC